MNNPLIYVDPSGNWCEATVNGKFYSHSGSCSNAGNEIPDYQHHARQAVRDFGDYIPGVSQVINGYESLSGKNIDGEKLSKEERTESAASIALGGTGKAASKVMKFAAKGTGEAYNRSKHYGNTPSKKAREETLKRDDYTCQYCGSKVKPEADHNPSLKYHYQNDGKNMTQAERQKWAKDPANLKTACKSCNTSKGAKNHPDQWTPADKYQCRKKGK